MPEFFIKIYMDIFDVRSKEEAEQKIKETPSPEVEEDDDEPVMKKPKKSKLFECFKR